MQPAEAEDPLWKEAKRLFAEAIRLPPAERQAHLERVCAGNQALLLEVESLLANHDQPDSFFERAPVSALKLDPLAGRVIGSYRVLRAIGQGGMGSVYLAERADDQFRRRVALKAVRPEFLDDQTLRRFENERRTLAVLDHPNIIKLLDGGTSKDGVPFLVMDYVEGQSIDQFCASRNLPIKQRLRLFREVLGAVHYAHQNLVVHRDLKPSNILVTSDGVPKLLDFGIARLLRPEYLGGPIGLTRTAMQPLTPEFASPEQVRGQPITTATDIYSLGVILYRLLTGHHPFERQTNSLLELERAICETDPALPSALLAAGTKVEANAVRAVRGDLDNIVVKAMRKEPQLRYASAEHFSEDIRRHLEGWPVLARGPGAWYRASRFAGRHRASCIVSAVFAIAIAVSATVAFREERLAKQRFNDLRSFANFVIGDFDDKLKQGVTPARKTLNAEALRYLDGLSKEAGRDPVVRRDLVAGYTRAGDVQGNPYSSNLGDMQAAEESYTRAIAAAQALFQSNRPDAASRLALARAEIGKADVLWPRGRVDPAVALYRGAVSEGDTVLAAESGNKDALKSNFRAWDHMMAAHENRGDIAAALDDATHCLKFAEAMENRDLQAYVREREGRFEVLEGKPADGERDVAKAVDTYEALGYTSASLGKRRSLAKAYKSLGDAQRANGNIDGAERSYRRSISDADRLVREEPKSVQLQTDLGQAYAGLIDLLLASGKKADAHEQTATALHLLRPIAEQPAATSWQMYYCAWLLVNTTFPDLRDDAAATRFAERMMKKDPADPEVLDVAARASARTGDAARAVTLERKALSANPAPDVRARIESELSALSGGAKPVPQSR